MDVFETERLFIRHLDDGAVYCKRKDGNPPTQADFDEALQYVDSRPGISVADVMRIFPGSEVVEPSVTALEICRNCDRPEVPGRRRGGKVIEIIEADGTKALSCQYCGRRFEPKKSKSDTKSPSKNISRKDF